MAAVETSLKTLCANGKEIKSSNEKRASIPVTMDPIEEEPKPKRPLSAYNFFFKQQRLQLLRTRPIRPEGKPRRSHGKIGFADLARTIAGRWKATSEEEKQRFEDRSNQDKLRYHREMEEWKRRQAALAQAKIDEANEELSGIDMEPIAYPKKRTPPPSNPGRDIPIVSPIHPSKALVGIEKGRHLPPRAIDFDIQVTPSELQYSDRVLQYAANERVRKLMLQYQQDPLPDIGWPDLDHEPQPVLQARTSDFFERSEYDFPPTTAITPSELCPRQVECDWDIMEENYGWTGRSAGV